MKKRLRGRAAGTSEGVETESVSALVPVFRLKKLKERLERLKRIADRAGQPFFYEIGDADESMMMTFEDPEETARGIAPRKRKVAAARVKVQGVTIPRIHGWRLIAALEGLTTPEGRVNLVFPFDQRYPVAEKYQTMVGVCDHCKKKRQRVTTFLLRSDKGQEKVVGRDCLADFLNTEDVTSLVENAGLLGEMLAAEDSRGSSEEEAGYSSSRVEDFEIDRVLFFTAWESRRSGYISAKRAEALSAETGSLIMSTPTFMDMMLRSPAPERYAAQWNGVRRAWSDKDSEDHKLTADVVQKTRDLFAAMPDNTSDYVRNVKLYLSRGFVLPKHLGLVCSAVGYYFYETAKRLAASSTGSVFLGEVDQNLYVPAAKLVFHKVLTSHYGTSFLHIFETPEGNKIVWISSSKDLEKRKGQTMSLLGTVKAHRVDDRTGVKETVLTRAVPDALPPPPPKEPKRSAEARASTAAKKAAKSLEKYLTGLRAGIAEVAKGGYAIDWTGIRRSTGGYNIVAELSEYSIARPSDKKASGLELLAMLGTGADKKMNSTEAKAFSEYMTEELADYHTPSTKDVPFAALVAWSQGRPATVEEKLSSAEKDRIKRNLETARVLTAGFEALKGTPFMKMLDMPSGGQPGDEREVSTVQVTRIWNAGSDALGMDTARGSGLYAVERLFRDEFGARYLRRDNDMSVYEGVRLAAIKDWVRKTAEGRAFGRRGR